MIIPRLLSSIITAVMYAIWLILGLRFVLLLFGARADTPFVQWVNQMGDPLLAPFLGIFPTVTADGTFVFDFTTLFALIVYTIVGYLLIELIDYISYMGRTRRGL